MNQDASQTYSFFILHSHSIAENKKIGRIKEKNRYDLEITDVTRGNTTTNTSASTYEDKINQNQLCPDCTITRTLPTPNGNKGTAEQTRNHKSMEIAGT